MQVLLRNAFAAIIGGLVVFAAVNYFITPRLIDTSMGTVERVQPSRSSKDVTDQKPGGILSPSEIYANYSGAVVHVRATVTSSFDDFFGLPVPDNRVSSGSGFIVSEEGHIITNAHVVGAPDKITVQLKDKSEIEAKLLGMDQSTDIALLKADLDGKDYKVLTLGDSDNLSVGQSVYSIGNPFGLDGSMSSGIISALKREIQAPNGYPIRDVIQTDAAINQGNSGGPLISADGKVIGVTAQIATAGSPGNIGIAFAIPSSIVVKVYEEISRTGRASHPWIGITGDTVFPEMAEDLKLKVDQGALVVEVVAPSPASKAGLKGSSKIWRHRGRAYEVGGDIITRIEDDGIDSMEELISKINQYNSGDDISMTIVRNGKEKRLKVHLAERPADLSIPR